MLGNFCGIAFPIVKEVEESLRFFTLRSGFILAELKDLLVRLDEQGFDRYMPVSELVAVEFDESSNWSYLNIGELKALLCLVIKDYAQSLDYVESFLSYNEHLQSRRLFYKALKTCLEITLDSDLKIEDYTDALDKMFGKKMLDAVLRSISGECKFYGLEPTNLAFENMHRHRSMINSYKKIQKFRATRAQQ